jgi:hypothetical protein
MPSRKFAEKIFRDGAGFFTILTVDHFNGIQCWHVSVTALSPNFKPIAWKNLTFTTGKGSRGRTWIA